MRRTTAAVVALVAAFLLISAGLLLSGTLSFVITSGISMQPRVAAGDLVVVARSSSYEVGDAAAYRSAQLRTTVLHRIVAVEADRYAFQGDNNDWLDAEKPTRDGLVGRELLHIPQGGIWLKRLTSPPVLAAYTFLLLTGGAAATTKRQRRKERRTMTSSSQPFRLGPLTPSLRSLAAGAAVLGLAGAALSGLAWTRPATTMTTAGTDTTNGEMAMDFSYAASVPPSPAYDGTTVRSPSPVFRALTGAVDVTYRYSGDPGSVTVDAVLSTSSGWTSTVPLVKQQRVGRTHEGTVRLDLTALEQRAAAAAEVIGVPAGALSIAVVPTVDLPGDEQFSPSLALTLDQHALTPDGELTVTQANAPATTITAPRETTATLGALGRSVDVTHARVAGLAALGLALLVALVIAAAARLGGRLSEFERMQRKYGALLLPVLPVALAPGRPVIDVPNVAALARLAERYGLLVLHWSRSGVDTYVVQDEATTFRYRSEGPDLTRAQHKELPEDEPLDASSAARSWGALVDSATRRRGV